MKIISTLLIITILFSCNKRKDTVEDTIPSPTVKVNQPYIKGKYHGLYINKLNNRDSLFLYSSYGVNSNDTITDYTKYKLYTKHLKEYLGNDYRCTNPEPYVTNDKLMVYYNCGYVISKFPKSISFYFPTECYVKNIGEFRIDTTSFEIMLIFYKNTCFSNNVDTGFVFKKQ